MLRSEWPSPCRLLTSSNRAFRAQWRSAWDAAGGSIDGAPVLPDGPDSGQGRARPGEPRTSLEKLADGRRALVQAAFEDIAHVAEQVPAVGHLHRLGRRLPGGLEVGRGLIPGDELDARVPPQPCRDGRSLAVREQVDDAASLEVDENAA